MTRTMSSEQAVNEPLAKSDTMSKTYVNFL